MLLGRHLAENDPSSISRTLQGFLSGSAFSAAPSPSRAVSRRERAGTLAVKAGPAVKIRCPEYLRSSSQPRFDQPSAGR